jgi:long-chain acyl-CoA synthetase
VFGHYLPLHTAGSVHCCPDPQRRLEALRAVRPQLLVGAPHVWQELAAEAAVAAAATNGRRAGLGRTALAAARKAARFADQRVAPPLGLRLQQAAFDRLVYTPALERLGLDACALAMSSAPPAAATGLLADLGLPVCEVYGRAESTGVASATRPGDVRRGTAGRPFPGVELRLSRRGEILVRGGNIMAGYHDDKAATGEVVDDHGWLHTGDRGRLDPDGSLTLADPAGPPRDYSR